MSVLGKPCTFPSDSLTYSWSRSLLILNFTTHTSDLPFLQSHVRLPYACLHRRIKTSLHPDASCKQGVGRSVGGRGRGRGRGRVPGRGGASTSTSSPAGASSSPRSVSFRHIR